VKRRSKCRKIIHENLHILFNSIREYENHASLKSSRGGTSSKRHHLKSVGVKGTTEGSFLLILRNNRDYGVTGVTIKKTVL